ncbi:DUF4083 domain-containing protein [Brevibacillus ruminantium]|uniref:DUF4083 domain-containing protein n=1 Tax=Brevibacillus ruminantium TaxID=2950604 RepID=A0ABY4WHA8_9BACL|nr:DUF4083 family protein [Brevibacillus ruminantium]USG65230.1 DUF4083 domain-containing protein [Brevibacillus ruminantium]
MSGIGVPGLILLVVVALIILFVVSFVYFIRSLLRNSRERRDGLKQIEEKLDRLIEQQEHKNTK